MSKIEQKIKVAEYLDNNENKKITFQNLWDAAKAMLRGKFIALNIDINK